MKKKDLKFWNDINYKEKSEFENQKNLIPKYQLEDR